MFSKLGASFKLNAKDLSKGIAYTTAGLLTKTEENKKNSNEEHAAFDRFFKQQRENDLEAGAFDRFNMQKKPKGR